MVHGVASQGQPKGKAEIPVVTRECRRSPPGSSIHWILQARVLEWDAIAFSLMNVNYLFLICMLSFCNNDDFQGLQLTVPQSVGVRLQGCFCLQAPSIARVAAPFLLEKLGDGAPREPPEGPALPTPGFSPVKPEPDS